MTARNQCVPENTLQAIPSAVVSHDHRGMNSAGGDLPETLPEGREVIWSRDKKQGKENLPDPIKSGGKAVPANLPEQVKSKGPVNFPDLVTGIGSEWGAA